MGKLLPGIFSCHLTTWDKLSAHSAYNTAWPSPTRYMSHARDETCFWPYLFALGHTLTWISDHPCAALSNGALYLVFSYIYAGSTQSTHADAWHTSCVGSSCRAHPHGRILSAIILPVHQSYRQTRKSSSAQDRFTLEQAMGRARPTISLPMSDRRLRRCLVLPRASDVRVVETRPALPSPPHPHQGVDTSPQLAR
jgi:hypothetical protein